MKRLSLTVLIFLMVTVLTVCGEEPPPKEVQSRVDAVTVYKGYANITRVHEGNFQPGTHGLRFSHLPTGIIDPSVRISLEGAGAEIQEFKITETPLTETTGQKNHLREQEKKELQIRRKEIKDQLQALARREKLLEQLSKNAAEPRTAPKEVALPATVNIEDWQSMLEFLETQLIQNAAKKRKLEEALETLEESEKILDSRIKAGGGGGEKTEKNINLLLRATTGGPIKIALHYLTGNATWEPAYDIRVNELGKEARLTWWANVVQCTGEDWKDAVLTFSTARPLLLKRVPRLSPITLDIPDRFSGEIRGDVVLEDGSAIPGVSVTLTSRDGTNKRTVITNESGSFSIRDLPAGLYDLEYVLEGFERKLQKGLQVEYGKVTRLSAMLETWAIQREIMVIGRAPLIDIRKSETSEIITPGMLGKPFPKSVADFLVRKSKQKGRHYTQTGQNDLTPEAGTAHPVGSSTPARVNPNLQTGVRQAGLRTRPRHPVSPGVAATFTVKHRETVLSEPAVRRAPLATETVAVSLEHVAVPRRSGHAFLNAVAVNSTGTPLLPGRLNIYYKGNYVNTSRLKFVNPTGTFQFPLGADEMITSTWEPLKTIEDKKGVFKKKIKKHLGYLITLKNFHSSPLTVNIFDQVPVSKNNAIRVLSPVYEPEPIAPGEKLPEGVKEWKLTLEPGSSRTIRVEYDLLYPKGLTVEELM